MAKAKTSKKLTAKPKASKRPTAKPTPTAKRPEEPLYKHALAIRAQWVGQAEQAWYLVLTKEGKALGWTPTKLLEAMNSFGIVHFVHADQHGQIAIDAAAAPKTLALGYPKTPKGTIIAFYEYESHEFSNGDFGMQS